MGEKLYLSVLRGPTPGTARAVITSEDQEMIRSLLAHIHRHIPGVASGRPSFDGPGVLPDSSRPTCWRRGDAVPDLQILRGEGEERDDE